MTRLLLDTSYLAAQFNPDDALHKAAGWVQDQFMAGRWQDLILLDSVFAETVTVIERRRNRDVAKQVGNTLRSAEEITLVHAGPLMDAAWPEYMAGPARGLSYVDCTLVAAAGHHGIKEIATFDRGFDKVLGVTRVPAEAVVQHAF